MITRPLELRKPMAKRARDKELESQNDGLCCQTERVQSPTPLCSRLVALWQVASPS